MKHQFTDLDGTRYVVTSCDGCHRVDLKKKRIGQRVVLLASGGSVSLDLCPECWDHERAIAAEASMFLCAVCGGRRTSSTCATCILRQDDINHGPSRND